MQPAHHSTHSAHEPVKLQSAFNLFTPSIEALKLNLWTLLGLVLTPVAVLIPLIIMVIAIGSGGSDSQATVAGIVMLLAMLAYLVLCVIIGPAIVAVQLRSAMGEKLQYGGAFDYGLHFWLRYLGLSFVTSLLIGLGFLLFIVPGVFLMKRYLLVGFYMVDRNLGVFESMKQCAEDSKKFSGALWGLMGVQILVAIASIIPFVGIVIDFLYVCAPAVRYLEIKEATHGHHAHTATVAPTV